MDEHRAFSDPTIDKLGGTHPQHPRRPRENGARTQENAFANDSAAADQGWNTQLDGQPAIEQEHWRLYATPAATPTRDSLEPDDMIHVDIAPVEPGTDQSNWESFIHQLGENR